MSTSGEPGADPAPPDRPPRIRVRATPGAGLEPSTRTGREPESVFVRGLVRAQLRLALAALLAFLVLVAGFAAVLVALPAVGDPVLVGVPLSWLLHAYGLYPLILGVAVLAVRAAGRNERRYRTLTGDGEPSP